MKEYACARCKAEVATQRVRNQGRDGWLWLCSSCFEEWRKWYLGEAWSRKEKQNENADTISL